MRCPLFISQSLSIWTLPRTLTCTINILLRVRCTNLDVMLFVIFCFLFLSKISHTPVWWLVGSCLTQLALLIYASCVYLSRLAHFRSKLLMEYFSSNEYTFPQYLFPLILTSKSDELDICSISLIFLFANGGSQCANGSDLWCRVRREKEGRRERKGGGNETRVRHH